MYLEPRRSEWIFKVRALLKRSRRLGAKDNRSFIDAIVPARAAAGLSEPCRPYAEIILGFSSVGKSTYMRHLVLNDPAYAKAQSVYGFMLRNKERTSLQPGDLFHLDISAGKERGTRDPFFLVQSHPFAAQVFKVPHLLRATVLVAKEKVIRQRISERKVNGIGFGRDNSDSPYPRDYKLGKLNRVPLADRYDAWFQFLESLNIPYVILRTDLESYQVVKDRGEVRDLIASP